jgi:hypothetical protein
MLVIRSNFVEVLAVVQHRPSAGLISPYIDGSKPAIRPWRANEVVMLASMDVLPAGVGYLLCVWSI